MAWSYTSVTKIIIPSLNLYYGQYVSTGIYQVKVSCPVGYTGSSPESPTKCTEFYGDGLRVGNEEWDDGNLNSNDGCNQRDIIESKYACYGGSSTTKDHWFEWVAGYFQSKDKRDCHRVGASKTQYILAFLLLFSVLVGIKASLLISVIKKRYPNNIFFYIENIQVLMLLPTIHMFFSQEVMSFLFLIRFPLMHFDFFKIDTYFYGTSKYDRSDLVLRQLGFRSQSAIINLTNWLFTFPMLIIVYCTIYFFLEKSIHRKIKGVIMSPLRKFTNWMTPGLFIKWINLSFILLIFISFYEVQKQGINGKNQLSWRISVGILAICAIYGILTLILSILVGFKENLRENIIIGEFFNGLKDHKTALSYPIACLLHKASLAIIASSSSSALSTEILGYFLIVQILFTIFVMTVLPLTNWKDNFIKIINELFVIALIIPLFHYKTTDSWSNTFTWVYISFILANSFIMTLSYLCKINS